MCDRCQSYDYVSGGSGQSQSFGHVRLYEIDYLIGDILAGRHCQRHVLDGHSSGLCCGELLCVPTNYIEVRNWKYINNEYVFFLNLFSAI